MKKQTYISGIAIVLGAILLTFTTNLFSTTIEGTPLMPYVNGIVQQDVVGVLPEVEEVEVYYYKDQLLGVMHDSTKLNVLLREAYASEYQEMYPNTNLGLSVDIHHSTRYVMEEYENKDDEIVDYIRENELYSVESNQISFSNGSVLYVENLDDYEIARREYLLNFIDEASYRRIANKETLEEKNDFGSYVENYGFTESATITRGYAPIEELLQDSDAIVAWFFHGYDEYEEIYTVEEGDTVQGVASKNALEVSHLIALNKDKIISENQLIPVGMKLNVRGIDSPLTLNVERRAVNRTTIYPDSPEYIYDDSLALGVQVVEQEEILGYTKDIVNETYENGVLTHSEVISSTLMESAQKRILRIGTGTSSDGTGSTQNAGNVLSGSFRYPVNNAGVTCGWLCYSGHQAMDVRNVYNRYGEVYAADAGTVITNSYHYVNGYYMEIDHGNGFVTYYGHMNEPGYIEEGEHVEKGQVIGQIGMTGVATGPHVHFEIRYHGEKMDPAMYLR